MVKFVINNSNYEEEHSEEHQYLNEGGYGIKYLSMCHILVIQNILNMV